MKKRHTNKDFAAVAFCTLLFALAATSVQAQQVFIPIPDTGETWIDDNPILQQTAIGESDCYYIRKPIFFWRNRHILSLQDGRLVYTRVYRDDWESWLLTGYWKPEFHRYELQLSQSDQRVFSDLMDAATQTAKYNNMLFGVDGTNYYICSNSRRASVWSPEGNSRTTRTIRALNSLCYAVEHNDYAVLRRQLDTCRTLTDEFRQLYQSTCNFLKPDKPYPVLNIHISSDNEILVNDTPCSLQQLKDVVKTFMDTSGTEIIKIKHLGEYPVSRGVINFSSSRNALYKLYCDVQKEITTAINELRDDLALKKFGKKFEHLDTDFQDAINEAVPLNFEK